MESTTCTAITNMHKNLRPESQQNRCSILFIIFFLTIGTLALTSVVRDMYSKSRNHIHNHRPPPPPQLASSKTSSLHPIIKNACRNTRHPSLCYTILSSFNTTTNYSSASFHQVLDFAINQIIAQVEGTRNDIWNFLDSSSQNQDLIFQLRNALKDCLDMLDQTLYELQEAVNLLRAFALHTTFGNLKTLLSAAMTNENTCIDGFSDSETLYNLKYEKGLKEKVESLLVPVIGMISNCLAMVSHWETIYREETVANPRKLVNKMVMMPEDGFLDWMSSGDGKLMRVQVMRRRRDVIVAKDGSGDYRMISEAVRMAPNMSFHRYVIQIKAGVYKENVVIPREKSNIMLVGEGMNSTVIMGSRNFADGYSTFTSATLTVVGGKFLARDLTIINTSGPEKHQAVALRVTSDSAFYHCNIISYQDTLYAHSLRQFYRECAIQGTVDFIFGNAAAIFQNCVILVRKPILGQRNMITAQGREDPNQNTGISLQNCTILAAPDFTVAQRKNFSTFLGRPWRNYSRTIVMNSYLGDLIHPQGWSKWNEYSNVDTVEYIEHMNFGPGSDTRRRVRWAGYRENCSEEIARQFTVSSFLHGADRWLASTILPLLGGPQARRTD